MASSANSKISERSNLIGSQSRISSSGSTIVRTTQLDQFATPDLIKMDIEGEEALALLGAQRIVSEHRTIWFIELHGDQAKPCIDFLEKNGYRIRNIGSHHILAEPEGCNNC